MTDLAGWTIVSDDDNGSILVQSPQGHRRRIWRDETEEENATLLEKVNEQQAKITRLRLAYDALRHATLAAHSSHFDRTGGSGTGCFACIDIRAARKNADEVAGYPWLEEE